MGKGSEIIRICSYLYGALDRKSAPISPELHSLVTVRVSQINWCKFCVDINSATLAKRSGSLEKVDKLAQWQDSDLFDEKERVVTAFYFAHPYSSWERGVNENTNGLIRQYFSKKTDFKTVTDEAVYNVMEKLNNRPRKTLGFRTPFQAMQKSLTRTEISCVALQS